MRRVGAARRLGAAWLVASAGVWPADLRAQPQSAETAAAEALFDEALRLSDGGHYAEACDKFAESERLAPATGTLLNLARCMERTGKTASAWAAYLEVAAIAHRAGDAKRERAARAREAALRDRLATLTIVVPPDAAVPGLVVERDETSIEPAEWGVAVPVDPGKHELHVSAPSRVSRTETVVVEPEGKVTLTVTPLRSDSPGSALAPPSPTASIDAAPVPRASASPWAEPLRPSKGAEAPPPAARTMRALAVAAGAIGVVAAGTGAYFGFKTSSQWNDALGHCPAGRCDETAVSLSHDAGTSGTISTVAFVVAAVGIGAGFTLWFSAPSASKTGLSGAQSRLFVGPGGTGIRF